MTLSGVPTVTLLVIAIIGGIGAAGTFASYNIAERIGDELTPEDLLPAPPWEGLPLPRFVYTKPHLVKRLLNR